MQTSVTRRAFVSAGAALAAALAVPGAALASGSKSGDVPAGDEAATAVEPCDDVDAYLYDDGLLEIGPKGFEPDGGRTVTRKFEDYVAYRREEVEGLDSFWRYEEEKQPEWWSGVRLARAVGPVAPKDASYMFAGFAQLMSVRLSDLDTSACEDMGNMFTACSSLMSLDVSGFDTSACEDMESMFWGCSSLESLDVSGFETSACEDMNGMFFKCPSLISLDVSGFDTSACLASTRRRAQTWPTCSPTARPSYPSTCPASTRRRART
jgi:surface protein